MDYQIECIQITLSERKGIRSNLSDIHNSGNTTHSNYDMFTYKSESAHGLWIVVN